jgi:Domain of unknown function (DUF6468)
MIGLILDGIVACLLVVTIWFAIRLDGRLRMLRADGERMERLIAGLSAASHQAEEAVGDLKDTAAHAGRQLQASIDKAQSLLSDLQFMNEKAEAAADRLDGSLRDYREANIPVAPAPAAKPARERRPVEASVAAAAPEPAVAERPRKADTLSESERMAIDLDQTDREIHNRLASLLKQAEAAGRNRAAAPATPAPKPAREEEPPAQEAARPIALQSRAEREFMKAMEARK